MSIVRDINLWGEAFTVVISPSVINDAKSRLMLKMLRSIIYSVDGGALAVCTVVHKVQYEYPQKYSARRYVHVCNHST